LKPGMTFSLLWKKDWKSRLIHLGDF